ncbi:unnamed protein product [Orchesella dallaii]|uniref:Gustatory receptor n=1 Tax=Orchesella dallaii TaxID=48710 RepID=A0ABP1RR69_9HEXA
MTIAISSVVINPTNQLPRESMKINSNFPNCKLWLDNFEFDDFHENHHHHYDYHLPTYLEWYSKVLYYFCFIPFRPVRKGKNVELLKWKPQQLLCLITSGSAIFRLTIQALNSQHLRESYIDPTQLFFLFTRLSMIVNYNIWVFLFWRKQTEFKNILAFHQKITFYRCTTTKTYKAIHYLKSAFFCILPFLLSIFVFFRFGFNIMSICPLKAMQKNHNVTLHGKNPNPLNIDDGNDWEENWGFIMTPIRYFQSISASILSNFVDVLELCLAYTCMEVTTNYQKYMENCIRKMSQTQNKVEFQQFINICQDLKMYFHHVNRFCSEHFLCWFCMLVPWMSFRITESFPGMKGISLEALLYNYAFIITYAVALLFAAETRRQESAEIMIDLVHDIVFQKDASSPSAKAFMYNIEHIVKDVGLKGGHFFQYSYGFLGSTIGFVIAYSFFVFQFRVESNSSQK